MSASSFRSSMARAVRRSATARDTTSLTVSTTFAGWPTGLGRLSVTVLAICSGVRAGRRAPCAAPGERGSA